LVSTIFGLGFSSFRMYVAITVESELEESLDLVPITKLFAFGGDESKADLVYGHLVLAKHHVAIAFSNLVDRGSLGLDEAKTICLQILHTNPKRVYRL